MLQGKNSINCWAYSLYFSLALDPSNSCCIYDSQQFSFSVSPSISLYPLPLFFSPSLWKCIIECLQRKEIRPSIVQNSCRGKNVGIHQPSSKIASLSPFKTFRTRVSRQDLSTQPWCSKIIFHFCCYKRVLIITSVPLDCLDGKAIAPFTKINLFQYILCIGSGLDLLLVLFI